MSTFDAPDRETCQVRRARTNTPLQALVLMNDVQFVEAARKFAERIMVKGGVDSHARVNYAFRSVVSRMPTAQERTTLIELYQEYLAEFQSSAASAEELLKIGDMPRDAKLAANELAAWTMIAHLIFNLSEAVTKG